MIPSLSEIETALNVLARLYALSVPIAALAILAWSKDAREMVDEAANLIAVMLIAVILWPVVIFQGIITSWEQKR